MDVLIFICKIFYYLVMGYGAYVCIQAYRANKKKAWLLIFVFCIAPFFLLAFRTSIKAFIKEPKPKTYFFDSKGKRIETRNMRLSFPVLPVLLVVGLSLLAEEEIKKKESKLEEPVED